MAVFILDKLKRTVTGQRVADASDLDGAYIKQIAEATGTVTVTYQDASGVERTLTFTTSGEVDVSGKADTDLQNLDTDLTDAEKTAVRTRIDAVAQADIDAAITSLINGAPGALDTLNELAEALNDDAAFATSVTNSLAGKTDTDLQNIDADLALFEKANIRSRLGLGTASTKNTGSSSDNLALLGSGGQFDKALIPTGIGDGDIPVLDVNGDLDADRLPKLAGDIGGITKPAVSQTRKYNLQITSAGVVSLVEDVAVVGPTRYFTTRNAAGDGSSNNAAPSNFTGSAGKSWNAESVALTTWNGSRFLYIAQPQSQDDLTVISIASHYNAIGAFSKESYTVTIAGVAHDVWVSNEVQGSDALGGTEMEAR